MQLNLKTTDTHKARKNEGVYDLHVQNCLMCTTKWVPLFGWLARCPLRKLRIDKAHGLYDGHTRKVHAELMHVAPPIAHLCSIITTPGNQLRHLDLTLPTISKCEGLELVFKASTSVHSKLEKLVLRGDTTQHSILSHLKSSGNFGTVDLRGLVVRSPGSTPIRCNHIQLSSQSSLQHHQLHPSLHTLEFEGGVVSHNLWKLVMRACKTVPSLSIVKISAKRWSKNIEEEKDLRHIQHIWFDTNLPSLQRVVRVNYARYMQECQKQLDVHLSLDTKTVVMEFMGIRKFPTSSLKRSSPCSSPQSFKRRRRCHPNEAAAGNHHQVFGPPSPQQALGGESSPQQQRALGVPSPQQRLAKDGDQ